MKSETVPLALKIIKIAYILASLSIFLGIVFMCQPFSMEVYTYGFPIVLIGTVGYIILDHLKK
ncbi:MAG: hypothetical protein JRJ48_04330 [Deltaproteobacteria bacterium]|nr:hypothetical protein [Deltaproteobacteria bacterium]